MRIFLIGSFALCIAVCTIGLTGCGAGGETQKLEADSDVDWNAIEQAGNDMNNEMTAAENEN